MIKTRYIPSGSTKIADKLSDAVAYIYTNQVSGAFVALVYYGKQSKAIWHYRFATEAKRTARIAEAFKARQVRQAGVNERRVQRIATVHNFQLGHVLCASWGYDQTNVDFYQVTRIISDKMIEVRHIASDHTATGDMTGKVTPVLDKFTGDPLRRRAGRSGVRIDQVRHASIWEGRPMYESSYA